MSLDVILGGVVEVGVTLSVGDLVGMSVCVEAGVLMGGSLGNTVEFSDGERVAVGVSEATIVSVIVGTRVLFGATWSVGVADGSIACTVDVL
jgi:hypothetical protein